MNNRKRFWQSKHHNFRSELLALCVSAFLVVTASVGAIAQVEAVQHSQQDQDISFVEGVWHVTSAFRNPADLSSAWMETAPQRIEYVRIYDGLFFRADYVTNWPDGSRWGWEATLSRDQFQNMFRAAVTDDRWGLLDIYEGKLDEGILLATNVKSGTWGPGGPNGELVPAAMRITPVPGGFVWEWMGRLDGANWVPLIRLTHTRAR